MWYCSLLRYVYCTSWYCDDDKKTIYCAALIWNMFSCINHLRYLTLSSSHIIFMSGGDDQSVCEWSSYIKCVCVCRMKPWRSADSVRSRHHRNKHVFLCVTQTERKHHPQSEYVTTHRAEVTYEADITGNYKWALHGSSHLHIIQTINNISSRKPQNYKQQPVRTSSAQKTWEFIFKHQESFNKIRTNEPNSSQNTLNQPKQPETVDQ